MAYGRGLGFLDEQREKFGNNKFTPKLWLKDQETAFFWFITPPEQWVNPLIHPIKVNKRGGGTWNKDVLCARDTIDEPVEKCALCSQGAEGPWLRTYAMVYVSSVIHANPSARPEDKWVPKNRAGQTVYVQEPNAAWIFPVNTRVVEQLKMIQSGASEDPTMEEGEVKPVDVMSRAFILTRIGKEKSVTDSLKVASERPIPAEVIAARSQTPDVVEIIEAEMTMNGSKKSGAAAAGSGAASFDEFESLSPVGGSVADDDELVSF